MSGLVRDPWLWMLVGLVALAAWVGLRRKRQRRLAGGETVPWPVRSAEPPK